MAFSSIYGCWETFSLTFLELFSSSSFSFGEAGCSTKTYRLFTISRWGTFFFSRFLASLVSEITIFFSCICLKGEFFPELLDWPGLEFFYANYLSKMKGDAEFTFEIFKKPFRAWSLFSSSCECSNWDTFGRFFHPGSRIDSFFEVRSLSSYIIEKFQIRIFTPERSVSSLSYSSSSRMVLDLRDT